MKCVSEALPPGSHVFIDAGNCVGWSLHHLTLEPPTRYHINLAMAPMGFGVCAVIGGKVGAPDRTCLAIVGDGAFLMHGTEISTDPEITTRYVLLLGVGIQLHLRALLLGREIP